MKLPVKTVQYGSASLKICHQRQNDTLVAAET